MNLLSLNSLIIVFSFYSNNLFYMLRYLKIYPKVEFFFIFHLTTVYVLCIYCKQKHIYFLRSVACERITIATITLKCTRLMRSKCSRMQLLHVFIDPSYIICSIRKWRVIFYVNVPPTGHVCVYSIYVCHVFKFECA